MSIKIPKRFQLGGLTFTVTMVPDLAETQELLGCVRYGTQEIKLQTTMPGLLTKPFQEQVFLHELVHAIFSQMGDDDLNNEATVSAVAGHLYQALSTMEYK